MNTTKYLWLTVTPDKYELPLCVEKTPKELGEKYGLKSQTVQTMALQENNGFSVGRKIVKVLKDEDAYINNRDMVRREDVIRIIEKWTPTNEGDTARAVRFYLSQILTAVFALDGWISCDERLPDEDAEVLLNLRDGRVEIGRINEDAVAWMPIPCRRGEQK